jgi:hypothetical protein
MHQHFYLSIVDCNRGFLRIIKSNKVIIANLTKLGFITKFQPKLFHKIDPSAQDVGAGTGPHREEQRRQQVPVFANSISPNFLTLVYPKFADMIIWKLNSKL